MKISSFLYKLFSHHDVNKRIIVISDIHYYNKKSIKKLNKILNQIKENKPDYICIPGDLTDEKYVYDEQYLLQFIKNLSLICPVLISIGNHEFVNKRKICNDYNKELFNKFNKMHHVYVLDNNSKKIGNMNFIGITLPSDYYYKHKEKNVDLLVNHINKKISFINNGYNILLCHSPILISNKKVFDKLNIANHLNLVLCGHTHGGITPNRLRKHLKGRGIISPHLGIFVKNSYGNYQVNNTEFIVSSGVTKASHKNKFRFLDFLFAPEITIVDIKKKD